MSMSRRGFISSVAAASVAAGCFEADPLPDYGLETVELHVDSADVARLRAGTFTDTSVPAVVDMFGESRVAELSVAGRSSVDDFKKSYRLELDDGEYRLNAMSRDPSALRGYLAWQVFLAAGFETPALRHVALFLNREYLGLYLFHESMDADFFTARGADPIRIYAARNGATMERTADVERTFSSRIEPDDYADLERLVGLINEPATAENEETLDRLLDRDSVARYMAATYFSDNRDGVFNNFILYRTQEDPRFAMLPWDLDHSFWFVEDPGDTGLFETNAMMRRLWKNPGDRQRVLCELAALDHRMPPATLEAILDEVSARIEEAWRHDRLLGAGPRSLDEHVAAIDERNLAQHAKLAPLGEPCGYSPEKQLSAGAGLDPRSSGHMQTP